MNQALINSAIVTIMELLGQYHNGKKDGLIKDAKEKLTELTHEVSKKSFNHQPIIRKLNDILNQLKQSNKEYYAKSWLFAAQQQKNSTLSRLIDEAMLTANTCVKPT